MKVGWFNRHGLRRLPSTTSTGQCLLPTVSQASHLESDGAPFRSHSAIHSPAQGSALHVCPFSSSSGLPSGKWEELHPYLTAAENTKRQDVHRIPVWHIANAQNSTNTNPLYIHRWNQLSLIFWVENTGLKTDCWAMSQNRMYKGRPTFLEAREA